MTLRTLAHAAAVAAILSSPPSAAASASAAFASALAADRFVPGEVLVKFRPQATLAARHAAAASLGHEILATLPFEGWAHVRAAPGESVADAVAAWAARPDVEWAQPNFLYRAAAAPAPVVPNDPGFPALWGLANTGQDLAALGAPTQPSGGSLGYPTGNPGTAGDDMNLEAAWNYVTDCSSVVVAVVDSGVNYTHEDLAANMWTSATYPNHGRNFVGAGSGGDANTMDLNGHGTHVAGTIGAVGNNSVGTAGVCWKAQIMAVRVLDAGGSGSTAQIIQGIQFAISNGAKVINMSLGGAGGFDALYSAAIDSAAGADVVVVVAAGNDGKNNDTQTATYPCNFTQPNLVCVAALDQQYRLATFSNVGAVSVDVGAPGTNVVSTWNGPVVGDALTAPTTWTGSTTTAGGGWALSSAPGVPSLVDPATLPSGTYHANTDDRAWNTYDLTGAAAATLHVQIALDLVSGSDLRAAFATTAVDPFGVTGTVVADATSASNTPSFVPASVDVSGCIGATCTLGFQLQSGATTPTGHGVAITALTIGTVVAPSRSYNTENGTSMATPHTAGVAAMLRAYNPSFTSADVVGALEGGGRPVAALAGQTTSGRAVDAMGALAFVNPPSGLAYAVH